MLALVADVELHQSTARYVSCREPALDVFALARQAARFPNLRQEGDPLQHRHPPPGGVAAGGAATLLQIVAQLAEPADAHRGVARFVPGLAGDIDEVSDRHV